MFVFRFCGNQIKVSVTRYNTITWQQHMALECMQLEMGVVVFSVEFAKGFYTDEL
jgi:hypothetical protein